MHFNVIMEHRQSGIAYHLAGRVEPRRAKSNIVSLPLRRRRTHIHQRPVYFVNPAALVVQTLKAVAIENLNLVPALQIHPAVAAPLPAFFGHERRAKFYVQLYIGKLPPCYDRPGARLDPHRTVNKFPFNLILALFLIRMLPPVEVFSVEQHNRTFRRTGPQLRRKPDHFTHPKAAEFVPFEFAAKLIVFNHSLDFKLEALIADKSFSFKFDRLTIAPPIEYRYRLPACIELVR